MSHTQEMKMKMFDFDWNKLKTKVFAVEYYCRFSVETDASLFYMKWMKVAHFLSAPTQMWNSVHIIQSTSEEQNRRVPEKRWDMMWIPLSFFTLIWFSTTRANREFFFYHVFVVFVAVLTWSVLF